MDAVLEVRAHNGVDEDARSVNGVRVELPEAVEVLDLGDRVLSAHRRRDVEVARGAAIDQIAPGVADVGAHERDVALDRGDEDVGTTAELDELLALGGDRTDAGRRQEAAQSGAAAAQHLGERALRRRLNLETALVHRLADLRRGTDVTGDDLLDLALPHELDNAAVAIPGIVGVDREVADVHRRQMVDEGERVALADEAADGDAHAALQARKRRADADHFVLGHVGAPSQFDGVTGGGGGSLPSGRVARPRPDPSRLLP